MRKGSYSTKKCAKIRDCEERIKTGGVEQPTLDTHASKSLAGDGKGSMDSRTYVQTGYLRSRERQEKREVRNNFSSTIQLQVFLRLTNLAICESSQLCSLEKRVHVTRQTPRERFSGGKKTGGKTEEGAQKRKGRHFTRSSPEGGDRGG